MGLTQTEYAEKVLKIYPRVLMEIEKDRGNPTLATLVKIAKPFGLRVGFVYSVSEAGGGVSYMDHKGRERDKKVAAGKDKDPGDNPKKREPGTGKGQILYIADDFDKPLDDFDENK